MHKPKKTILLGIDTHHLLLEYAGTKRVTVNLLAQFCKMDEVNLIEFKPPYLMQKGSGIMAKISGHAIRFFWVHIHLPLLCYQKKIDVLLSPEFNTPLYTTCKRVVIAHDAHMRVHRQFTNYVWFYGYYIPFIETAIRRCDLIFTVSRFAKKQIAALMRVDERKIVVAYNGIDSHFTKISDDETRHKTISKKGLSDKEYILFVGTFEARKNIERLIEAFALVKKNQITNIANMKLAVVGKTASSRFSDRSKQINDLIYRLKLQKDIILCGYVPDDDLPHFYKSACMVVFPSLNEGFGFPVIEGFASSVPVLTSNTCSMPEIAGGAAILVDPESATDIAEKIELLLTDTALRKRLILAGKQRVKEFTWESCASQIISRVRLLISR